eukprot:8394199-Pyramimonas_sp.AAC.1
MPGPGLRARRGTTKDRSRVSAPERGGGSGGDARSQKVSPPVLDALGDVAAHKVGRRSDPTARTTTTKRSDGRTASERTPSTRGVFRGVFHGVFRGDELSPAALRSGEMGTRRA